MKQFLLGLFLLGASMGLFVAGQGLSDPPPAFGQPKVDAKKPTLKELEERAAKLEAALAQAKAPEVLTKAHKVAGVVTVKANDGKVKHVTVNHDGSHTGFDGKVYATAQEAANTLRPPTFKTGAKPTPLHITFKMKRHQIRGPTPSWSAFVPGQLSMWGNDQYGNCTVAEEAFHLAAQNPEIFISDDIVIAWGAKNGFNDGATLTDPMDQMAKAGMVSGGTTYGDGPYTAVNYSDEPTLQNAISFAPVKIGIDASALPSGAGNQQGWFALGGTPGQFTSEDHCVSLSGFGTAQQLYQALGVAMPSGLQPTQRGYLLYTWKTLGFVDHPWLMSTEAEAYLRNPSSTANGQPLPNPGAGPTPPVPPVPPIPPVPPTPVPGTSLPAGTYNTSTVTVVVGADGSTTVQAIPGTTLDLSTVNADLQKLQADIQALQKVGKK